MRVLLSAACPRGTRYMNSKYTRSSLIGGISGVILQTGSWMLLELGTPPDWLAYALMGGFLVGSVLIILTLCDFARTKGYSGFLGVLVGFSGYLSLLVCAFLPDWTKE